MRDSAVKTPRHLWIVGIASLLWNAIGAFDYIMTETHNEAYMGRFTQEQVDLFYGYPTWLIAFWALAVWGAVAGSVLLLMRRKLAATAFLVSFVCMLVTTIYNYGVAGAMDVTGGGGVFFSVLIFIIALLLVLYSRRMVARGVLV